jgi:hypothetical protein
MISFTLAIAFELKVMGGVALGVTSGVVVVVVAIRISLKRLSLLIIAKNSQ